MNRLAVCLGLHTAPWYSGYCTASSQTNSAFWASALSVSMLHNQDGFSINWSSSNKYHSAPMDKCFHPRTLSVSLHVHTFLCCAYTLCLTPLIHNVSYISHHQLHIHAPSCYLLALCIEQGVLLPLNCPKPTVARAFLQWKFLLPYDLI